MQRASGAETCEGAVPLTARFLIQTTLIVLIGDDARVEKGRQQGARPASSIRGAASSAWFVIHDSSGIRIDH